jgi:hypothetical protein
VIDVALKNLGVQGRAVLRRGINRIREVPTMEGTMRETAIFDLLDVEGVEKKVQKLFERINEYEKKVGFFDITPTLFRPAR